MIHRKGKVEETNERALLREALMSGLEAMTDPMVEAKVSEYFETNPNYSRDMVHVSAVACLVRDELAAERRLDAAISTTKAISHSL